MNSLGEFKIRTKLKCQLFTLLSKHSRTYILEPREPYCGYSCSCVRERHIEFILAYFLCYSTTFT